MSSGDRPPVAPFSVRAYVDWNNDRVFDGFMEDVTTRTRIDRPFNGVRGRDQIRMLAPPMAGSSNTTLDNVSRDYSPENTESPLYDVLVPGHLVRHEAYLWSVRYEREIDLSNPVAWWRGDVVGSTVNDSSGNRIQGTFVRYRFGSWEGMHQTNLTWEQLHQTGLSWEELINIPVTTGTTGPGGIGGSQNPSLSFNGQSQRVLLPDHPLLALNGPFSLELWIQTIQTDTALLVNGFSPDPPHPGYGLRIAGGKVGVYTDPTGWIEADQPLVNTGSWHHVVATFDGSTAQIYVDALLVHSAPAQPPTLWNGQRSLGGPVLEVAPGEAWFDGNLDEIAIYNYALSQYRILAHFTAGTPSPYKGEVLADNPSGWWRFDENEGDIAYDSSGNNRHGQIVGFVSRGQGGALFEHTGGSFGFGGAATPPLNTYVTVPSNPALGGPSFTVECWVRLDGYGNTNSWRQILSKENGGRNYGLFLVMASNSAIHWTFQTASGHFNSFSTLFQLQLRRWHYLAMSYEAGSDQLNLYIDGDRLEVQVTTGGDPPNTTGPLRIGGGQADVVNFSSFPGRIDEVAVYNRALEEHRIRAHHQAGIRGRYPLSINILDDLPQQPSYGEKTTSLPALGTLGRLRSAKITTGLYQNIRTDQAFDILCDYAGIPKDARIVYPGTTTLLWWWMNDEYPWDAAMRLMNTEGPGTSIYEDAFGRLVFEGHQYRLAHRRSTHVQATFADSFDEPWRLDTLDYNPGLKDIVNSVRVQVNVREPQPIQVVYVRGQAFTIGDNSIFHQPILSTTGDPLTNVITPVQGVDFTVSSGSITGVALDRTSGGSVTVIFTAGPNGAVINNLQVRGSPVSLTNTIVVHNNVDASESIAKFGIHSFPYDIWPEIDYLSAQDFCDAIVNAYQHPRPTVKLQVTSSIGGNTGYSTLNRQIGDRIAILDSQLAMVSEALVETIEYRYENFDFTMILGCERTDPSGYIGSYAIWGLAGWDYSRWAF